MYQLYLIDNNMLGRSLFKLYPKDITSFNNCIEMLQNCAFKLFNKLLLAKHSV